MKLRWTSTLNVVAVFLTALALSMTALTPVDAAVPASRPAVALRPASLSAVDPDIDVGLQADQLAVTPNGAFAYVSNRNDGDVKVIDLATRQRVATIKTGTWVSDLVASPDNSKLYVLDRASNRVIEISARTNTVTRTLDLPAKSGVRSLVVSPDGNTMLAMGARANGVYVFNAKSLTLVGKIELDSHLYWEGVWITPDGTQAYVSSVYPFVVTVFDLATRKAVRTIPSCSFVRDIVFTPDGSRAYMGCESGEVSIVSTGTGVVDKTMRPNVKVQFMSITGDGSTIVLAGYLFDWQDPRIAEIDVASGSATASVPLGAPVYGLSMPRSGTQAYVLGDAYPRRSTLSPVKVVKQAVSISTDRLAGADRYETAVAVSRANFWPGGTSSTVYVATGEQFPDALAAAPAANREWAPLLLTKSRVLPNVVRDEIIRLQPQKIVVVGGADVVSAGVFDQLRKLAPNIVRRAGADRYATARAVLSAVYPRTGNTPMSLALATGADFPDALSASSKYPVVLVNPRASRLDAATMALLKQLNVNLVYIVGDSSVVPKSIEQPLKDRFIQVERFAGNDRFETNRLVNRDFAGGAYRTFFAYGYNFPDALSAAAVVPRQNALLYLVRQSCIPAGIRKAIAGSQAALRVTLLGDASVVGNEVADGRQC